MNSTSLDILQRIRTLTTTITFTKDDEGKIKARIPTGSPHRLATGLLGPEVKAWLKGKSHLIEGGARLPYFVLFEHENDGVLFKTFFG